jgi:GNAT superfamily N-acetyltransferase
MWHNSRCLKQETNQGGEMSEQKFITELSEDIEQQALLGWFEVASQAKLPGYDWRIERIGDALCSVSSAEPSFVINRVLGLGSESRPTAEQLSDIRDLYKKAGVSRFFLHVVPGRLGPDAGNLLAAAGYRKYRGWMKFVRGPGDLPDASSDLNVRRIGAGEAAEFAAIAAPAFDITATSEAAIATLANDPHWHLFMSFDGARPAGTGAIYIRGQTAYTDWAATHPDFRRRGSQSVILRARIREALDAGCTSIVTMTGEAVEGDPQHSYRNILKAGFREAYLRENWIPAA